MIQLPNTYSNVWTNKQIIQFGQLSSSQNFIDLLLFGLPADHVIQAVKLTTLANFAASNSTYNLYVYVANPAVLLEATAQANAIPFPFPGKEAPTTTCTAITTGVPITGYFWGSNGAGDVDTVRCKNVTQNITGPWLFDNHTTAQGYTAPMLTGAQVNAGDVLEFQLSNTTYPSFTFSNIPGNSNDGINHFYFAPYTNPGPAAIVGIPTGVYVGPEDLPVDVSDLNYNDCDFVVENVNITTNITHLISNINNCYGTNMLTIPVGSGDSYEYGSFRWFSLSAPGGATFIRNNLPGNPTPGAYCYPQRLDAHDVMARFVLMNPSNASTVAVPLVDLSVPLSTLITGTLEVAVQYSQV